MKKVMIMAAGTGGHIFPGLAIAEELRKTNCEVTWLGTSTGMEQTIVPKYQIPMDAVAFTGLRGKGMGHAIKGAVKIVKSFVDCVKFIRERKPDVIVGMGGYVTVPGGLAAKLLGVPLVLVNADAGLLLSNKILQPFASKICYGFEPTSKTTSNKTIVTGNPVRRDLVEIEPFDIRYRKRSGNLKVLVVGGSLGAKVLNDTLPQALRLIPQEVRPEVTHQTGRGNLESVKANYANAGVEANVVEFIDDMPEQYKRADVVICRAGAITLSELTASGVASILVPFVASTTSHQKANAAWLDEKGAAIHLPQAQLSPQLLSTLLTSRTRAEWLEMASLAYENRRTSATTTIVEVLADVAQ